MLVRLHHSDRQAAAPSSQRACRREGVIQGVARMTRSAWLLALALLIPGESAALQLRWSTGASDVAATSAMRCTLVVQADSSEGGGASRGVASALGG